MSEPLFWLALSLLLVTVSLTAVLVALLPAIRELSRAARSAEKLFDTLNRDLPPTLEAIRQTGLELTELTDNVSEGVQSAGRMVRQVDQSFLGVQQQAKKAQRVTRSLTVGFRAAWQTLLKPAPPPKAQSRRRSAASGELEGDRPSAYPDVYGLSDDWEDDSNEDDSNEDYNNLPSGYGYGSEEDGEAARAGQKSEYSAQLRHLPDRASVRPAAPQQAENSAHPRQRSHPQPVTNPDKNSEPLLESRPPVYSPRAELDSPDPDSYTPKVYGSEQYDEPSLWDDDPYPESTKPGEATPLEPGA